MTFARCAQCGVLAPRRTMATTVTIEGHRYRTCGQVCALRFAKSHAAVNRGRSASGVFDRFTGRDFGPAQAAIDPIAVAARAVQNTRQLATRTDRIGRPGWRYNATPAALTRLTYCENNPAQAPACSVERCPCCEGRGVAIRCDACDGTGALVVYTEREAIQAHVPRTVRCSICAGRGHVAVTDELLERKGFRP